MNKDIVVSIILLSVFILLVIIFICITYRVCQSVVNIVEREELKFINWVRGNCRLVNGEWYYLHEPYSSEELIEIYNKQLEVDE